MRTTEGAQDFARHLLTKAAERLRRGDYFCRRLGLHLSWLSDLGNWWNETNFNETRDTGFLLARLDQLWAEVPSYKPLSVGVVLLNRALSGRVGSDFGCPIGRTERCGWLRRSKNTEYPALFEAPGLPSRPRYGNWRHAA